MVEVKELFKTYRDGLREVPVLKGLSLHVTAGQSFAVMGPSGCGKSTLISCLAGLTKADGGRIAIGSRDVTALVGDELTNFRAENIGIIFQQFHLIPYLTALENVRLPLDLTGAAKGDARALCEEALKQVGLSDRADHFPNQLSRGECQRVAIARVLVARPKVILADEPTASLDRAAAKDVIERLVALTRAKGVSLIVVTHDPEIAGHCDHLGRFIEGRLEVVR